jgi:hypothetical protein
MATYLPNVTDVIPEPALFTPNFSFLDTMLRRRQGLYEQGFAQVNSAYNFVNRNVTNPYSAQTRDRFLKQAHENLKNLSSLDLSQQQNVQSAASVFEPFVKNKPVLMDMAFTAHMDQQENIAETFRLKDGGKEFSEDNIAYLRQQRAAFANDDISSVGNYYANRRSFTPYYDYNKEIKDAMKDFKPSTYKVDHINGLYKITKDDKSWREAEVSEYLNGVLSDKAKQQMRIESQVRLNNSPETLSVAYKQVAEQQLEMNKYNMDVIDKQLITTKDPKAVAALKTRKQSLEDSNREIDTNIQNISKGDLSYIKNNSEKLSTSIYFNGKLSGLVKAYAHEDITTSIDADQVGLALMREARADARQARALAHAEKMKMLEVEGLPGNFQTRELAEGEDGKSIETSINKLQSSVDANEQTMQQISLATKNHILTKIKERDPNSKLTVDKIDQAFIANWLKTGGPGGKAVLATDPYYVNNAQLARLQAEQNVAKNKITKIEQASVQGMTDAEKKSIATLNQKIESIGTITLDDGSKLSGKELAIGIKNGTITTSTRISGGYNFSPSTHTTTFKINGKEVKSSVTYNDPSGVRSSNNALLSAYNQIQGSIKNAGSTYDKYIKNRESYIKNNFADLRLTTKVVSFDAGSPNAKSLEGSIGTFLPEGYDFKHAGVGATSSNQGNAYFYITPKGDGSDTPDEIATKLTAAGAKVRVIKTEKGPAIFEVEGLNNRVANQFRQYTNLESAVVNEMQSYTGVRDYQSAPFTTPYGDTRFIIKKSGNLYYLHVNGLGETYPDTFSSPTEAISMARLLSANGGSGAKMFMNEVSGSNTQYMNMSGMDYDYRYE